MKTYVKKPDSIKAVFYTGKNKAELKKNFNVIEKDGVVFVTTPLEGNKKVKPDSYVYTEGHNVIVESKKEFELKFEEVTKK